MEPSVQISTILGKLVAIPTVPGAANAEIIDLIVGDLIPRTTRVKRIASPLGDVDGLILSIGPDVQGGLVLSGHLDVVATEGQQWTSDPFRLRRDAGRLWGRGVCDMKGFIACALSLLTEHGRKSPTLPLHLVLSADEETTCQSIDSLIRALSSDLPPVRGVIVGEPTNMVPVDRHKASATHHVAVTGRAVHASLAHTAVNAISVAARLVEWLDQETLRAATARYEYHGFNPDHALHSATQISGGNAVNTIAGSCHFDWDMRLMPDDDIHDITSRFDAFALSLCDGSEFAGEKVIRTCTAAFPALKPEPLSVFRKSILSSSDSASFAAMPFGTEAGYFQKAGFDTVVCGPGSADVAHIADEYIEETQLQQCLSFLRKLV